MFLLDLELNQNNERENLRYFIINIIIIIFFYI